ncbi:EAL domain-containing protein [Aquincola sp. S2]|uniref:EAL domain-containing protein n=1 Tax=Pseudaquabacterium terrae TaxID=2732868 RepID=A0ABX2ENK9_9BURK|nr:GGDEF domain-containing response regulator [Aquabacterium terrae]NRF70279.1 EAL domain-containing protein [Aquabacterium terrae]
MHRLLSIESSPTLRRGIERLLVERGFAVRSVAADDAALPALEQELALGLSAVLLGWNTAPEPLTSAIVARLAQPDCREIALLVLTPQPAAVAPALLAERKHTRIERLAFPEQVPGFVRSLLAQSRRPPPARLKRDALKVLLVDDSKTSRTKYRRLLQTRGYAVTTCDDPHQALELVGRGADRFDLAIIDYYMPGMNGAALCRTLRGLPATQDLTLAILTASYTDELIHDCLEAGAAECMFKDESNALFLARVHSMARLRERELRLNEERQRLALILDSVGDGLYGVDRSGHVTFANRAALRALGYAREDELVGESAHDRIHPADEQGRPIAADSSFLQHAYELGDSLSDWETVFWRADGEPLSVECNVRPQYQGEHCSGVVVAFRDITERKRFEAELQWQLQHDHLTRLYNRRHFEHLLEQEVIRLRRSSEQSALLFIDLDRFKHINDTAGHAAGDALLATIGRKLHARARESDAVARLSGDEFAVLLRNVDDHGLLALAETFRAILDDSRFAHGGREFEVSGSVGAIHLDRHTASPAHAMNCADAACRLAKQQGRNRIHRFDLRQDTGAVAELHQSWSQRLRSALESDGFALQYQAIVDLPSLPQEAMVADDGTQHLQRAARAARHGHEVFLRLDDLGTRLHPKAFLSHAERFNLLPALDAWVLERIGARLTTAGAGAPGRYHVNVAAASLLDVAYVAKLEALARHGSFAPGCLYLELKESDLAPQLARLLPTMNELAALGVRFVLDEFGRGFAPLDKLRSLPISAVKLDASLVQALARDPFGATLVRTMTELAHAMNLKVIAPAVEDLATLRLLQSLGLDRAQGFVLERPADPAGSAPACVESVW